MELQNIEKVYSGKRGKCMCGCAGKYSYAGENDRSVKIIAGKVLRNPNAVREGDYVFVEQGDRILVVYYKD